LILVVAFERHYRTLRGLQPLIVNAQVGQNLATALANDAREYSKHNPAIDSILRPAAPRPQSATNKPAAKN
jgi:hypothetical protein